MNIQTVKSALNDIEFAGKCLRKLYEDKKIAAGPLLKIADRHHKGIALNKHQINFVRSSLMKYYPEDIAEYKSLFVEGEAISAARLTLDSHISICNVSKKITDMIKRDFTIINPKWVENNYMGRWQGDTKRTIELYDTTFNGIALPAPCLSYVNQILDDHGLKANLIDNRQNIPVDIKFSGELRELQTAAANDMLNHDYGTLVAATGSGKTVVGLYLIAERSQKTIVIVHTKDLAHQWIAQIKKFLSLEGLDVGLIGAGSSTIGNKITVALVQSIYKRADELKDAFGMIIVDESHRTPSRTFSEAVNAFNTRYRLGLTATPLRNDKLQKLIFYTLGDIRHEVNKKELIDEGHIMQPWFIMRCTQCDTSIDDPAGKYVQMVSELCNNEERNNMIVDDIAEQTGSSLIISDRKWHLEEMKFLLADRYKIDAEVLVGSTPDEERKSIIARVNAGTTRCLFATGQLIGEGFDCKMLNTLFITTPIKFAGRVLQYIGRIMRPAEGKERPIVYDYVDLPIPQLVRSAKARMHIYGKENIIEKGEMR
jgi:superfamily II DNA or RNA helicase